MGLSPPSQYGIIEPKQAYVSSQKRRNMENGILKPIFNEEK